jgi:hypothetical protein
MRAGAAGFCNFSDATNGSRRPCCRLSCGAVFGAAWQRARSSRHGFRRSSHTWAADRAYWTLVEVGTDVLTAAETLVATHPIRTLDAVHVASARLFAARVSMPALTFVSADKRQAETAIAVGLCLCQLSTARRPSVFRAVPAVPERAPLSEERHSRHHRLV